MSLPEENGFKLGCLPRTSNVGDGTFEVVGDDELIPRKDWPKHQTERMVPHIRQHINQRYQGSCCASAGCHASMLARAMAGLEDVLLSQASLYAFDGFDSQGKLIPRRSDNGMAIDTCLRLLQEIGACPASVIDPMDWEGYRRGNWPDDWKEKAKPYQIVKGRDVPTFDHAVSRVMRGNPVHYGTAGHAVLMIGWIEGYGHLDWNTHGLDWGDIAPGVGQWRSERETERGIRQYGAWELVLMTDPIDDGDLPACLPAGR